MEIKNSRPRRLLKCFRPFMNFSKNLDTFQDQHNTASRKHPHEHPLWRFASTLAIKKGLIEKALHRGMCENFPVPLAVERRLQERSYKGSHCIRVIWIKLILSAFNELEGWVIMWFACSTFQSGLIENE